MATSLESLQLVDQSHPARNLVAEEVLDRRLLQPLHAFPTGLLPKARLFTSTCELFSCSLDG
jgi:hypothetical protein